MFESGKPYDFFEKLRPCPIEGSCAYGSGWKWAQAAMDCGMSAPEAIEYAITKDIYTGGDVHAWTNKGEIPSSMA